MTTKTKLIVNRASGQCLCVGEVADRPLVRMRGLIGRRGLPAGEGILLTPAPAIHTAFMRFPIDALFLDHDLQVVRIVEELRPWRVASKHGARAVLELAAGECARRKVAVGDNLELRDRRPVSAEETTAAPMPHIPAANPRIGAGGEGPEVTAARLGHQPAPIQPLRVLVISPDHHFRSVMSLLLARRNCSVTTTASAARAMEIIRRERADVAVLDASRRPGAATVATVATIEALGPLGVVVLGDPDAATEPALPVLAKWGPFDDLLAAIVAADQGRWRNGVNGGRS